MTPSSVKAALDTALSTITGLRVFDYVPDGLAPPAAVIEPFEVEFDAAMQRGLDVYTAYVLVIVGRMSERTASDRLDVYLAGSGAGSVKAAIDGTLGGAVASARVTRAEPRTVVVSGIEMLAYRYEVEIYG